MSTHQHKTTANKDVNGYTFTVGDDPSNISNIQIEFIKEFQRRFSRVQTLIRKSVGYENDALNLSSNADELEDTPKGFTKQRFLSWLRGVLSDVVLGENTNPIQVQNGEHWTAEYIETSARAGVNQAIGLLYQEGLNPDNPDNENLLDRPSIGGFLEGTNGRYYKAFNELKGITDDVAEELGVIYTEGYQEGWNPRKMATEMADEIESITKTRATTLARTETQNSHTRGSLRTYQREGVGTIGHVGRMVTPDNKLCPFCRKLRDEVFTIQEFNNAVANFRGQTYRIGVPAHPNCRCSVVPKVGVDEDSLEPLSERVPGTLVTS